MTKQDTHTFSNYLKVVTTHIDLFLHVDFNTKTITGKAIHHINNLSQDSVFTLDTYDLAISKIGLNENEEPISFKLDNKNNTLGQALHINIKKDTKTVSIYYETSSNAPALQWLNSIQTNGKSHPLLFTQSQAILARSWIPCQDTPSVKFTWSANVTTDKQLAVVMSGIKQEAKNKEVSRFEMTNPVPSYLLALCCGNLKYKAVSKRCGIYAEPEVLDKAHSEFIHVEDMVTNAEKLYGKYLWEQFDLLVLPSSFPFGGMENPCLTFVTPTLLAGDRSLTNVVAHELAHSWSGNLVTNATWNDFWLNEGFTVYFERRIMEEIEDKSYAELLAYLGYRELLKDISKLGNTSKDTCLKLQLENRDPDDGMTLIAYEKGFLFLKNIELAVGRKRWDTFIRTYFNKFAFKSISTEVFLAYLSDELIKGDSELIKRINAEQWVYQTGIPATAILPKSTRFDAVKEFAGTYIADQTTKSAITNNWTSHEWVLFIMSLPNTMSISSIEMMDAQFGFSKSHNAEILFAWLVFAITNNYERVNPVIREFLMSVGRRKFVEPLFRALAASSKGKEFAISIYNEARSNYHFVTSNSVDELLKKEH